MENAHLLYGAMGNCPSSDNTPNYCDKGGHYTRRGTELHMVNLGGSDGTECMGCWENEIVREFC